MEASLFPFVIIGQPLHLSGYLSFITGEGGMRFLLEALTWKEEEKMPCAMHTVGSR